MSRLSPSFAVVFRCSVVLGRYRDHALANIRVVYPLAVRAPKRNFSGEMPKGRSRRATRAWVIGQ